MPDLKDYMTEAPQEVIDAFNREASGESESESQPKLSHDIRTFGAIGDGDPANANRNRAAILEAFNEANRSGIHTVWIPPGDFVVNRFGITFSGIRLVGSGWESILRSVAVDDLDNLPPFGGTVGGLINIYPATGYTWGSEGSKLEKVELSNFRMIGPYSTRQTYKNFNQGIIVESINHLKISNMRMSGFGGETIVVGPGSICNFPEVSYNYVHDSGNGMDLTKCRFGTCHHNKIERTWDMSGIGAGGAGMLYTANHILDAWSNGIWAGPWWEDTGAAGAGGPILITNNYIARNGVGGAVNAAGIFAVDDHPSFPQLQPIHILGNHIYQARMGYGIQMFLVNALSECYCQNNHVTDTGIDRLNDSLAIWCDGNALFVIDGNVLRKGVDGSQDFGIHVGNIYSPNVRIGINHDEGHTWGSPTSSGVSVWRSEKRATGHFIPFTANDATPDVRSGENFKTANTAPTTITQFDLPHAVSAIGKKIHVLIDDANTTVSFSGANLKGNGGVDWAPASQGDFLTATWTGSVWLCETHTV
jgi:hypothetical protein